MSLVSVIMTAYNAEKTLGRTIQTVLNQKYKNFKLIIIDDCSSDETLNILKEFKKNHENIRVVTTSKNYGTFVCKNYGMKIAKGDYFTFRDSDDWCSPYYISSSFENLKKSGADVSYTGCKTEFDEDVKDYRWIKGVGAYLEISTHSAFFSRKVFEEVGYFDSVRFGADNELRKRFKAMGYNVSERKEIVTYYYLKREGSLTCNTATGYNKGKSKIREVYIENYTKWHEEIKNKKYFMEFPLEERPFRVTARHKPGKVDLSTFTEIS